MQNSPSIRLVTKPEAPKKSKFRLAIVFILTIGAGIGINRCIYDKKATELPDKADGGDVVKPDASKTMRLSTPPLKE